LQRQRGKIKDEAMESGQNVMVIASAVFFGGVAIAAYVRGKKWKLFAIAAALFAIAAATRPWLIK
jgi:hypothetical protein